MTRINNKMDVKSVIIIDVMVLIKAQSTLTCDGLEIFCNTMYAIFSIFMSMCLLCLQQEYIL